MNELDDRQAQDEGHVPLFSLAPGPTSTHYDGTPYTAAPAQPQTADPDGARFQHDHTFGYDVRLVGQRQGNDDYYSGYDDPPKYSTRFSERRWGGLIGTGIFLVVALGILLLLPATRSAIGHFFSGSTSAPPAASASPSSDVLNLGNPTDTPAPTGNSDAGDGSDPSAVNGDTATPTPAPTATPAPVAGPPPVYVKGTYTTAANGATSTTCQNGKISTATCTWHVTVQPGHQLDAKVTWTDAASLEMTVQDAAGNQLDDQVQSDGTITIVNTAPPANVYVIVSVAEGSNVHFTLGLADHAF